MPEEVRKKGERTIRIPIRRVCQRVRRVRRERREGIDARMLGAGGGGLVL